MVRIKKGPIVQPGATFEFTYVLASGELPEFAYPNSGRKSDVLSITMNGENQTTRFECGAQCSAVCHAAVSG